MFYEMLFSTFRRFPALEIHQPSCSWLYVSKSHWEPVGNIKLIYRQNPEI